MATIGLDTGTFPPSALHLADPLRDHRHRPHLLRMIRQHLQRYPQPHLRQSYLRQPQRQSYLRRSYRRQRQSYLRQSHLRRLLLEPTLRLSQEQRTLPMR